MIELCFLVLALGANFTAAGIFIKWSRRYKRIRGLILEAQKNTQRLYEEKRDHRIGNDKMALCETNYYNGQSTGLKYALIIIDRESR